MDHWKENKKSWRHLASQVSSFSVKGHLGGRFCDHYESILFVPFEIYCRRMLALGLLSLSLWRARQQGPARRAMENPSLDPTRYNLLADSPKDDTQLPRFVCLACARNCVKGTRFFAMIWCK